MRWRLGSHVCVDAWPRMVKKDRCVYLAGLALVRTENQYSYSRSATVPTPWYSESVMISKFNHSSCQHSHARGHSDSRKIQVVIVQSQLKGTKQEMPKPLASAHNVQSVNTKLQEPG